MKKKQKTYQFILVLKNVDEGTPHLEDSLFEAGCDDALINFRNGTVFLDFDREGTSLEEAVMSAIENVESASVKATVANVAPEDIVTESEIAKRLTLKRQAVSLWIKGARRNAKPFPRPVIKLSEKSPFWKWREVVEWLYENKLITEKEEIENALFLETINSVLANRDATIKKSMDRIVKKFEKMHVQNKNSTNHKRNCI